MQGRAGTTIDEESYRFFNQQELDAILREGSKQGRNGSRAAIERILRHEPQLERADLWKRIRKLKDPPRTPGRRRIPWSAEDDQLLRSGYESRSSKEKREVIREVLKRHPDWPPSTIWKRARRLGLTLQNSIRRKQGRRRRWSKVNDRQLLNLAGELKASAIATILHRSERAVRCRLAWLGERARVHSDGYARRSLAEELHLGRRTVQRFIVEGLLEVRDPRITRQSIAELKSSGIRLQNGNAMDTAPAPDGSSLLPEQHSRAKQFWARAAAKLNVSLATVERLLVRGTLKLCDPRITEASFTNFCRNYGALIQNEFLNQETRAWLRNSMQLNREAGKDVAKRLAPAREHALVVRKCDKCGRTIRGNVFFKHSKNCRGDRNRGAGTVTQIGQLKSKEPVSA